MDESLLYDIFGVDRTYRCTGSEVRLGAVYVALEPKEELLVCPDCGSTNVIRKGKRTRQIQTLPIGFHPVVLQVEVPRCRCKSCQKTFEVAPPFARPTPTTPAR